MGVYQQALEHLRAESVALKPKRSMDLKHAQRVLNVLWVSGAYVNLKNLVMGWAS